jgi:hypothetical protein
MMMRFKLIGLSQWPQPDITAAGSMTCLFGLSDPDATDVISCMDV